MSHFNLNAAKKRFPPSARRRATPKKFSKFRCQFYRADWSSVYNTNDVNLLLENFINTFNKHLGIHIPKKKDNHVNYETSPRLPWISKSILRSINRKIDFITTSRIKELKNLKLNMFYIKIY